MSSAARKPAPATLADLDALPPSIKGEIIDGVLHTQPRPRALHMRIATRIADDVSGPYDLGRGGPGGWWILVEPGIELPGSPEFSPDLAGWHRERLPDLPDDEPVRVAPDWACEILCRTTRGYDQRTKRPFYARIGVGWLWFVDPEARTLSVSKLVDGHWYEVGVYGEDDRIRPEPFAEVEITLADWWGTRR